MSNPILLYDGVCGLCNRLVQFILRRDRKAIFRFAALQSPLAANILSRHNANAADLDTLYVVLNQNEPNETLLARSDAVIFILNHLPGMWPIAGFKLRFMPRWLRDWGYGVVAHNRYKIFGRRDSCPLPTPETRARFLDQ
ncbi:MAG TPA: DCC1-like thiol-disulfide oxidoreductase family protein [Candidatus Solibacter sp.]|nr:DCC1-like thiol-disulfide oxidoreductase family protein [Candidatus Solibacter sp.]